MEVSLNIFLIILSTENVALSFERAILCGK